MAGNSDPFGDLFHSQSQCAVSRIRMSPPRFRGGFFNVPTMSMSESDIYGADSADNQPSDRNPEGFDNNNPAIALLVGHGLIQICALLASASRRIDLIAIRLGGSPLYTRRYTKLRPVFMVRSLRRPVCLRCGGSMSSIQLATTADHHQRETGQDGPNHDQHEDDAG